jgi:hypothetical protein
MDTIIAPVVRQVVGIAGLFQDAFVERRKWFRADRHRPDDRTRHVRRVFLSLATATALQTIDRDDNIGPLKYLDQSVEKALAVVRSRLEIFF